MRACVLVLHTARQKICRPGCGQNLSTKSDHKNADKRLNMYLVEENAEQQRTQHIAAHNTSSTVSTITITITAPLIINHGADPQQYTGNIICLIVVFVMCCFYFLFIVLTLTTVDSISQLLLLPRPTSASLLDCDAGLLSPKDASLSNCSMDMSLC